MKTILRSIAAVLVLTLSTACAAGLEGKGRTEVRYENIHATADDTTSARPKDTSGSPRQAGPQATAPPSSRASKAARANETLPLHVTVSRACVEPGQEVRVVAETVPNAQMAFTAYYPGDNNFAPDMLFVPSEGNPTGTITWAFVLRPATPPGAAQLDVLAMKPPRGATYQGSFRVAYEC